MGVFKRISDIVSANLNDMTEGFEDPERMLRQAVREMEETIAEVTNQTAKAMANETTLSRELERNRVQQQQWQARAEKAVEEGSEDLARKALTRKNEHEKLVAALKDQLEAAQEASGSLRCQLAAMKAKMAEGRRNLATLSARKRAADFRKKMETQVAGAAPRSRRQCLRQVRPHEGQSGAGRGGSRRDGRAARHGSRWHGGGRRSPRRRSRRVGRAGGIEAETAEVGARSSVLPSGPTATYTSG